MFWIKTCKDVLLLLDVFLGALLYLRSTGVEKYVGIALLDVERDGTIVCVLLHFQPTDSLGCLWLSQETDSMVPRRVFASAAGLFSFS